ncbi:MAG TPA: HAD family hydrolase [Candidatus Onthousia excrementipullorum]|uniref:HAD family hydrolase n=1 Tax=Candidatus Onthousia excrementipullorum TaxID=2840884 RepID=A0A9D1DVP5_9FIRM|nr:HAD family hydrolase [Candidatus Onthousia excrementipullorum]
MKNKEIDAIIFDLDGTLWNTVDSCLKATSFVKEEHSDITRDVTKEQIESAMGKTSDEIVNIYYGYLPREKGEEYANEAFNKNVDNLLKEGGTLYPNTRDTIIKLSKKYKLYIVSNCVKGYIESFLNTSGLKDYFSDYESYGNTLLSKGDNIKLVIERNNLKNPIYVGDTKGDMEASNYAGIPFVYAAYGFGKVEGFDYKINDISELLNI